MSTNSTVTVKTSDNKYHTIYGHWDGYPEHVGRILKTAYTNQEKIEKLISLGSFSSLGENIDQPDGHSFDTPAEGFTVFYHRDRGEDWEGVSPSVYESFEEAMRQRGLEYNYLWEGKEWFVAKNCGKVKKLTNKLCGIKDPDPEPELEEGNKTYMNFVKSINEIIEKKDEERMSPDISKAKKIALASEIKAYTDSLNILVMASKPS